MNEKKIMRKTCGFARAVVRKTQEIFEISQLKFKMIQVKNRIERKYVRIGFFVYNKQKNDGFEILKEELEGEKFKNVCDEIDELYDRLKKLESEYNEIKKYIKKQVDGCVEECGCRKNKQKKEQYTESGEEFEEQSTVVTKKDEYNF